jgi:hypothetical protein
MRGRVRRSALWLLVAISAAGCVAYMETESPVFDVPPPEVEVEIDFFYARLSPYGQWLRLEPFGWVWTPWGVGAGWHPYTYGYWIRTVHGWTWVSYWRWGWAPFHYGRWTFHAHHGWVWIPGRHWGPGWVAWRHGGGWIGWAPLPPAARWQVGVGLQWDGRIPEAHWWSFVEERDFLDPRLDRRLVPVPRNLTLLERTREVTRYEERDRSVLERSVPVDAVERARGALVQRREIEEIEQPPDVRPEGVERRQVQVYRPEVRRTPPEAPAPARASERQQVPRQQPAAAEPVEPPRPERSVDQQRRELEAWKAEQRSRLAKIHEQERQQQQPPAGASRASVAERQKAEREELRREVSRHRQVIERRVERAPQDRRQRTKPPT